MSTHLFTLIKINFVEEKIKIFYCYAKKIVFMSYFNDVDAVAYAFVLVFRFQAVKLEFTT